MELSFSSGLAYFHTKLCFVLDCVFVLLTRSHDAHKDYFKQEICIDRIFL